MVESSRISLDITEHKPKGSLYISHSYYEIMVTRSDKVMSMGSSPHHLLYSGYVTDLLAIT